MLWCDFTCVWSIIRSFSEMFRVTFSRNSGCRRRPGMRMQDSEKARVYFGLCSKFIKLIQVIISWFHSPSMLLAHRQWTQKPKPFPRTCGPCHKRFFSLPYFSIVPHRKFPWEAWRNTRPPGQPLRHFAFVDKEYKDIQRVSKRSFLDSINFCQSRCLLLCCLMYSSCASDIQLIVIQSIPQSWPVHERIELEDVTELWCCSAAAGFRQVQTRPKDVKLTSRTNLFRFVSCFCCFAACLILSSVQLGSSCDFEYSPCTSFHMIHLESQSQGSWIWPGSEDVSSTRIDMLKTKTCRISKTFISTSLHSDVSWCPIDSSSQGYCSTLASAECAECAECADCADCAEWIHCDALRYTVHLCPEVRLLQEVLHVRLHFTLGLYRNDFSRTACPPGTWTNCVVWFHVVPISKPDCRYVLSRKVASATWVLRASAQS